MSHARIVLIAALAATIGSWSAAFADSATNVQLVGHDPLYGRGMNAALAIYGQYVYVGNRTDGSSVCVPATGTPTSSKCPHPHPGILIVDVTDPAHPKDVGEIGRPYAGNVGITTRELRVWPWKKLLIVMDFRCSSVIHACPKGTDKQYPFDIAFFSLADPVHPKFLSRYVPTSRAGAPQKPHEMFLWLDPQNQARALLYLSTPNIDIDPTHPNLIVADISGVADGQPAREVAEGNWNGLFPGTHGANYPYISEKEGTCGPYDCNLFVHSMSLRADGRRAYLAMEAGQFLVLDTSDVVDAKPGAPVISLNDNLMTMPADRPTWLQSPGDPAAVPANCKRACPNGHSAVEVPGRPLVVTTDEVYGTFTSPNAGCPWGWERLIDVSDQTHPKVVGEYKIPQDEQAFCGSSGDGALTEQYTSYSAHNPTVLPHLAIIAWHSGGLQIIDTSDPANQRQAGAYSPTPLAKVATEDPALTRGASKVVFWSYPIIRGGLIYVIDVRNGLYILKYTGTHADEVSGITFLEGNSNVGILVRVAAPTTP